ncbi:N-acetyltransferase [Phaeobacter sp. 22II1-1F12B]|uniref:GNAT family N-acetyltransferase n=1 Tax=Phaeobacter sp. 22II1-1F12B TaxID=1317111 RepID=UPI000B5259CD|nr:GNAT family N-acetyltransferase [Phaeobacter sp. 22II1-1F12B]OWU81379.1 acetyltransferase [Phaeobacter sp. 22II1-1F12B]
MTAIHLAKPEDFDRLDALVAAFHQEEGIELSPDKRRAGLFPLLEGIPHGVAYLIGPARAPIGYIVLTFTWSVEYGGLDGFIDEIYLRPAVRGRGIASEVMQTLPAKLAEAGLNTIHLEVDRDNTRAMKLYERIGFRPRESYVIMSKRLRS